MAQGTLLGGLLMGLLLLATAVAVTRIRNWERVTPAVLGERPSAGAIDATLRSPAVWTAAFAVLVLLSVAAALGAVGGLPMASQGSLGSAFLAVVGGLLLLYFAVGLYVSARGRGLASSMAAGLSSAVLGLLLLTAIVVKLVMGL